MTAHADTDAGDLGDGSVRQNALFTEVRRNFFFQNLHGFVEVVAADREAEVGQTVLSCVLHDHVNFNVGFGNVAKNLVGDTRGIGHVRQCNLGFVSAESDAGNNNFFHLGIFLKSNQGTGVCFFIYRNIRVCQAGEHAGRNAVFTGKFHTADLKNLGAEGGHFQNFLKRHNIQFASVADHARISCVNTVDVGEDKAFVCMKSSCQGNSGSVGTATAERCDVALFITALEARNNHNLTVIQVGHDSVRIDLFNTSFGEGVVCQNSDLSTCIAASRHA